MSIYKEGELPFWAQRDETKRLVYRLPSSIIVKKKNNSNVDKIMSEARNPFVKVTGVYLGGFDGNGNRWLSRSSVALPFS